MSARTVSFSRFARPSPAAAAELPRSGFVFRSLRTTQRSTVERSRASMRRAPTQHDQGRAASGSTCSDALSRPPQLPAAFDALAAVHRRPERASRGVPTSQPRLTAARTPTSRADRGVRSPMMRSLARRARNRERTAAPPPTTPCSASLHPRTPSFEPLVASLALLHLHSLTRPRPTSLRLSRNVRLALASFHTGRELTHTFDSRTCRSSPSDGDFPRPTPQLSDSVMECVSSLSLRLNRARS